MHYRRGGPVCTPCSLAVKIVVRDRADTWVRPYIIGFRHSCMTPEMAPNVIIVRGWIL